MGFEISLLRPFFSMVLMVSPMENSKNHIHTLKIDSLVILTKMGW